MSVKGLPRILITPWRRDLPTFLGDRTVLDTLDPSYSDRVALAGGLPLVVPRPPEGIERVADEVLALADGLLVSGGGDVDPATYGAADGGATEDVDADADAWELLLVRRAAERRLPTLGICRGAQVLAVAFGGRLAQELDPAYDHRDLAELAPDEILGERHPVTLRPGSRVAGIYGPGELPVNTIHHQAVADPGELAVTATAAGGLIEAVEPQGELAGWPALGVQWHPEKMSEPEQLRAFRFLVREAEAYRTRTEVQQA